MEDNVKAFLESGQLESYVIGVLSDTERLEVEYMISEYPTVKAAYEQLQDQIEVMARQHAISPPAPLKEKVMHSIADRHVAAPATSSIWLQAAAAILLIATGYMWYSSSQVQKELTALESSYATLQESCSKTQAQLVAQQEELAFVQDGSTELVRLEGSKLGYLSIAFVNEARHKVMWKTIATANLPSNKCLQLWGDHDGKMIPLAVLKNEKSSYYIDLDLDYESLNITMEDITADGRGQAAPDVSQLVASAVI